MSCLIRLNRNRWFWYRRTPRQNRDQQTLRPWPRRFNHLLLIRLEIGAHGFFKADCLSRDHVHQRATLATGEYRGVQFLVQGFVVTGQNQTAAGPRRVLWVVVVSTWAWGLDQGKHPLPPGRLREPYRQTGRRPLYRQSRGNGRNQDTANKRRSRR